MKYCKKCNELKLKWYMSETVYQNVYINYNEDGHEHIGETSVGDYDTNGDFCLDCNCELDDKEISNEKELIKWMIANKVDSISMEDTRILHILI